MRKLLWTILSLLLVATACSDGSPDGGGAEAARQPVAAESHASVTVPDAYTPVVVSVLGDPTFPFLGTDGRYHVAYDLQLTNTSVAVPATIEKLEVVDATDPDTVIEMIEGDQLLAQNCDYGDCNRLRNLLAQPADDVVVDPQESQILFVDYSFDTLDGVPDQVLHHLYAKAAAGPPAQEPSAIDYLTTPYSIDAAGPLVVGPPLRGDNWVALNGCCQPGFPHRSSPAPLNGRLVNAQRFAIDWKQMNDAGGFFEGNPNDNENYVDYGADVLAIADATVIATLDGMAANTPGTLPANDPAQRDSLNVGNVDGNHIVLDLGDGTYAMYAHLKAGSLEVSKGDVVKRGDKIAELGNTGNSNASHLHLHLMDGPSILGSNGLPYVIDNFEYAGQVEPDVLIESDDFLSGTFNAEQLADPQPRVNQLPLLLNIVNFPK